MRKTFAALLVAGAWAFSAIVYGRLPERMATHWNLAGQIDGWSSRAFGAFGLPTVALFSLLLLHFLPRIDPKRGNYAKFEGTYDLAVTLIVGFLVLVHVLVLGTALGWPIDITRVVPPAIGALFLMLGNVLPRARQNWWFGVRTPWTLSDERVWMRTHRVSGRLLVIAGVLTVATVALPTSWAMPVLLASITAAALGSVAYSYVAWRQERGGRASA